VEVPFTRDVGPLRDAMELWRAYGTTALHDAVSWLPEITGTELSRRNAAILITDGDDNSSTLTAANARDIVARSKLPVYVLGIESGNPYRSRKSGGALYPVATILNLLAYVTGGSYYSVKGPSDVTEACHRIVEDVRSQYVLAFPLSGEGKDRYRSIRVEVKKKHSKAVHRQGYTGGAPASR
jgi:VWFA-related protein